MRKSLPLLVLLATAAAVPVACSSKGPVAPSLTVDAGFIGLGGLEAGAPGAPEAGAPVASATPAPSSSAAPDAGAPAPSGSIAPLLTTGADAALDAAIQTIAAKDAPGMTAEGSVGHETLQQGGHFNMVVTLQPGKCYTIIAMSAPLQVSELDVRLLMLPLSLDAGHSPPTDKNPAVLGRGKAGATCPVSPIPVPYKVDVAARKGAGRIAVAVFSRNK